MLARNVAAPRNAHKTWKNAQNPRTQASELDVVAPRISFEAKSRMSPPFRHVVAAESTHYAARQGHLGFSAAALGHGAFEMPAANARCVADLAFARNHAPPQLSRGGSRRIAVLLRGAGFRDNGAQHTITACCNGSDVAQQRVALSHERRFFPALEATGATVDVFIASYHCTNGLPWASELLPKWYGRRLVKLLLADIAGSSAYGTTSRGLSAIWQHETEERLEYEAVLSLRLDTEYAPFRGGFSCLLKQSAPLDNRGPGDTFQLLPRGYFRCAARHAAHCEAIGGMTPATPPSSGASTEKYDATCALFSHQGVRMLQALCGEANSSSMDGTSHSVQVGAEDPVACTLRRIRRNGADHWREMPGPRRVYTAEPHDAGCSCTPSLAIVPLDPNRRPDVGTLVQRLELLGRARGLPSGGCAVQLVDPVNRSTTVVAACMAPPEGKAAAGAAEWVPSVHVVLEAAGAAEAAVEGAVSKHWCEVKDVLQPQAGVRRW